MSVFDDITIEDLLKVYGVPDRETIWMFFEDEAVAEKYLELMKQGKLNSWKSCLEFYKNHSKWINKEKLVLAQCKIIQTSIADKEEQLRRLKQREYTKIDEVIRDINTEKFENIKGLSDKCRQEIEEAIRKWTQLRSEEIEK